MLCAELECLEAQLDDLITALENSNLPPGQRAELERAYAEIVHLMDEHRSAGHAGSPCFEPSYEE